MGAVTYVLASRSPRRRELLELVVPARQIMIMPPRDAAEPGFEGLHDRPAIERRLAEIARAKAEDVLDRLSAAPRLGELPGRFVIVAADTTIVAAGRSGGLHALGQPPEDESWAEVVRIWFRDFYAGRAHQALTALCIRSSENQCAERIVSTEIGFISDVESRLEWYLASGEPRGKAGGYAIQGLASIFVERVDGSLSNVIGLPLESLLEVLALIGASPQQTEE